MNNQKSQQKRRKIDGGRTCPKCGRTMQRYEHTEIWRPKPGKAWYAWWDRCLPCQHLQHYDAALRGVPEIDGGEPCPKCSQPMKRFEHACGWKPKPKQPYFFSFWDKCMPCGHTQMYEKAKVLLGPEDAAAAERAKTLKMFDMDSPDRLK